MLVVLTTTPTFDEAETLAARLVEQRLAACVQILSKITSVYVWDGEVQKETEHLLLVKTLPEKWGEVRDFISENHSYEVPEIIALEAKAAEDYLSWLKAELTSQQTVQQSDH